MSTPAANESNATSRVETPGFASVFRALTRGWEFGRSQLAGATERFLPPGCIHDPELARRARLIVSFGFLGVISGTCFAIFYALIDHSWGARIVVVCSCGFAIIPWLLQRTGSLAIAGNTLSLFLTLGFTALCCVEGGSNGHAIAWLVSVPLCALLLVGRQSGIWWVIICFAAGSAIVAANLAGYEMRPTYDLKWHPLVNAAGYLSLIIFMFVLGMIFETGRERAFNKLQEALAKLKTSNEQLAQLNQEKNEFMGMAAHDLKNPLTVIIGSAELLGLNLPPEKATRLSSNILGAGKRMLQLIKDLLDANAIEQGRFTSNIERCDLRALALECAHNNQTNSTRKEIVIATEAGPPAWGRADRNATMQILDNLISNAVKFSPPKTTVLVRTVNENGCVLIAVKDQGPGISEADQKKLFGKFTRLSAQPTGGETSTGLGLSIVKKLAEAMAGSVYCQSVLGEGATFILRLPAWDAGSSEPIHHLPALKSGPLPLVLDTKADSLRMSQPDSAAAATDSKPA